MKIGLPKIHAYIKILLLGICILSAGFNDAIGQASTDKQLALQFYQDQEYEKAAAIYERLYSKSHLNYYYSYYYNCLIQLDQYDKAEKLCKKQIKKNPEKLNYLADLGFVHKKAGNLDKSVQQNNKAIKILGSERQQINSLANAFIGRGEEEMALATYQKGRKTIKSNYAFHFELAYVFHRMGRTDLMIEEYLDYLNYTPTQKNQIQNLLQSKLFDEINTAAIIQLKDNLLKRIQKYPDRLVFPEMLIWFYIQQKDFKNALMQAKAVDKRKNENGDRIIKLGKLCLESENFETAITCFQYVIDNKPKSIYYLESRMALLDAYNKKIIGSDYGHQDLIELESNYETSLTELGKSSSTLSLIRGLAHLKAFYLNNTKGAAELLTEAIKLAGIKPKDKAYCKLELADILLLKGLVWDASLY